jgi:SAM-dependent methyltransferase
MRRVCVVGIGDEPYVALRFLASGSDLIFSNDIKKVKSLFDICEIDTLLGIIKYFNPEQVEILEKNISINQNQKIVFKKIQTLELTPFEETDGIYECDLVYSNSVLEHVHNVSSFYRKLSEVTKAGGFSYHSIDLRDHLNFFRPLEFLRMSPSEYSSINTENRLRSIDHIKYLEELNFEILKLEFDYIEPGEFLGLESVITKTLISSDYLSVPELFSDNQKMQLDKLFWDYENRELGIVGVRILARKFM